MKAVELAAAHGGWSNLSISLINRVVCENPDFINNRATSRR
jgi:hypothetical protein